MQENESGKIGVDEELKSGMSPHYLMTILGEFFRITWASIVS